MVESKRKYVNQELLNKNIVSLWQQQEQQQQRPTTTATMTAHQFVPLSNSNEHQQQWRTISGVPKQLSKHLQMNNMSAIVAIELIGKNEWMQINDDDYDINDNDDNNNDETW